MTPTPDQETLEALRSSGGWVTGLATLGATAWGVIRFRNNRVQKLREEAMAETDALQARFDGKADDERVTRHQKLNEENVRILREELEKRRVVEAKLFDQMREDKSDLMHAMTDLTKSIGALTEETLKFQATVATELGRRPTREELRA